MTAPTSSPTLHRGSPETLDAGVVARLLRLAEQTTALDDSTGVVGLHGALAALPGVQAVKVCVEAGEAESGGVWGVACGSCRRAHDGLCALTAEGALRRFDVAGQGVFALVVDEDEQFAPYEPLVRTLPRLLARSAPRPASPDAETFRAIADHFPDHVAAYDRDCRRIYINPVMARALGRTQAAAAGQTPREGHPEGGFGEYQVRLRQVMESGTSAEMELILPQPHAELTYCHVRFAPIRDPRGEVVGAIAVGRDTTRQKVDGDAVRRLWFAAEQSPVSIVITDADGRIEHVNAKFTEVTGYAKDEVLGQNPRILKSGQMNGDVYAEMWATLKAGGTWRGELCNKKKSGEIFWERVAISPVNNALGVRTSYVAVKEDITEHKVLEAALRQAQKMEAFGQLTAGVAHDFNNLLTVIIGNVEEVRATATDPDAVCALTDVADAAARAATLTRQLLTFSRRQVPRMQRVDLGVLVSDLTRMLRRLIGEQVSLETRSAPALAHVRADPSMIELVLVNLAVNARDAMPRGGTLDVEVTAVAVDAPRAAAVGASAPGRYVRLSVRDTGTGIDPQHRARIFEPFFTTKEVGRGTGLGLATVFGIVQQHGGFIEVESALGVGTTFHVFLPHADASTDAGDVAVPRPVRGGTETLLLVEDDVGVRSLFRRELERAGYRVRVATNGAEALVQWRRYGPELDLVVSDVVMPGAPSGRELAAMLAEERPTLPVILMSGYTADLPGGPAPSHVMLPKPLAVPELLRSIREALDVAPPAALSPAERR